MALQTLRVAAPSSASATVIFLHGLGDSSDGWSFLAQLGHQRKALQHVNFLFPNAPQQPVTANFGMRMPSWHDITTLGAGKLEGNDEKGVAASVQLIEGLIKEEIKKGIKPERIVLGGFSQGAAISLATSMISEFKLGGFMALSGYMPCSELFAQTKKSVNDDTHTIQCHGQSDPVVPFSYGVATRDFLKQHGRMFLEWHQYPGLEHSANEEELDHVLAFLERVLPQQY